MKIGGVNDKKQIITTVAGIVVLAGIQVGMVLAASPKGSNVPYHWQPQRRYQQKH